MSDIIISFIIGFILGVYFMPDEKQLELLRNDFRKASGIYIKKMFEKK